MTKIYQGNGAIKMNLKELNDKIRDMTDKIINKHKLDYEKVHIQYTKTGGKHMLWAMHEDKILEYIEWG